jgi:DNA anti-recombination protein RmuC
MADQTSRGQNSHSDDTLRNALTTIIESLIGGELKALKSSVDSLSVSLKGQIEAMKKEASAATAELRKDVYSRLNAMAKSLEEAQEAAATTTANVETRLTKAIEDLKVTEIKESVRKSGDELRSGVASIKSGLEKNMQQGQQALKGEIDVLKSSLAATAGDCATLRAEVKRSSAALSNMARVFSGAAQAEESLPATPPQPPSRPQEHAAPAAAPQAAVPAESEPREHHSAPSLPGSHDVLQHMDRIFNLGKE